MKLKSLIISMIAMAMLGFVAACDSPDDVHEFPEPPPGQDTPGGFEQPEPPGEPYTPEAP